VVVAAIAAGYVALGDAAFSSSIAPAELAARIASGSPPVILDVRNPFEYAAGHVPGARNIPFGELARRLSELGLAEDDEVVVLCESGGRAAVAATVLRAGGISNVRKLAGEMRAWRREAYPIER
jgi:rhodanese-related sulfurtransferase